MSATRCPPPPAERRLAQGQLMARAARSVLYKRAWGDGLARFATVHDYAGLRALPFISGKDLRAMEIETEPSEWACCDHIRLWISTSGTTGTPKWVPISDGDVDEIEESALEDIQAVGIPLDGRRALALNAPAPYYSDIQGAGISGAALRNHLQCEMTIISFIEMERSLGFALRQRAESFVAFPSIAMALAEGLTARLPEVVRQMLNGKQWLARPLIFLLQRVVRPKPRHLLNFRWGVFAGEPLEPYRKAIQDAWGMESFEMYGMSELRLLFYECHAHQGIHIWLDRCLPEIIPQDELEREQREPGVQPATLPLWEAQTGLVGELVLTSFSDALPLIRYRTSDLVTVVGTDRCLCGRADPRIRVLHRADDIVNLGVIRFSILAVGEQLARVQSCGRVADWQIRVTRDGYKPKLVVVVRGVAVTDPEGFAAEVRKALEGIQALAQGLKNSLVAEPEIRLEDALAEERTSSGKLRRLIYEKSA